jgi:hypothetical protein
MFTSGEIGQEIVITGSGLYLISAVVFGGEASGEFNELEEGGIRVKVPQNVAWGYVRIESEERGITSYSQNEFVPQPEITGFNPITGLPWATVDIHGYAFSGVTGVLINNLPSLYITISNNHIEAVVPSGNSKGPIKILARSGLYAITDSDFESAAVVTGASTFTAHTGDSLEVYGINFLPEILLPVDISQNTYLVGFGNFTGAFTLINSEKLTGIIPEFAESGPVHVFKNISEFYPSQANLLVLPSPPNISRVTPSSGKILDRVVVEGSNFLSVSQISLSGSGLNIPLTTGSPTVISSLGNAIFFDTPTGIPEGKYDIIITASGGSVTGAGGYHVLDFPYISGFLPSAGKVGDTFTISGLNLYPFTKVYFNSTTNPELQIITSSSANNILEVRVPFQGLDDENYIIIDNTVDTGVTGIFTYVPVPALSSFSPTTGLWGTTVMISGSGLNFTNEVVFDDYVVSFNIFGSTGVSFVVPTGSDDSIIKITTSGSTVYSSGVFDVIPPLVVISGFTPTQAKQGESITLTGSYFNTATGLAFSGLSGLAIFQNFLVDESGQLTVIVPVGARLGQISIYNQSGLSQSPSSFRVLIPPTISGFGPQVAIFQQTITISGQDFVGGDTRFYFVGVTGGLIEGSGTSILASGLATTKVPREIIRGVIYASGRDDISSFGAFTPLPTITGFAPTGLSSQEGNFIIISGVNAYESSLSQIWITGSGKLRNLIDSSGYFKADYSQVTNGSNGFTVITGYINAEFLGTGKLSLVTSHYTGISSSGAYLNNATFTNNILTLSGANPTISGFSTLTGTKMSSLTISGNNFYDVTGVKFIRFFSEFQDFNSFTIVNSKTIVGTLPNTAISARTGNVIGVMKVGSTQVVSGQNNFTFTYAPSIISITPSQVLTGRYFLIQGGFFAYAGDSGYLIDGHGNSLATTFTYLSSEAEEGFVVSGSGFIPADITLSDQDLKFRLINPIGAGEYPVQVVNQRDLDTISNLELTTLLFS